MRSKLKKNEEKTKEDGIKLDSFEESIKKLIEKAIKEKVDTLTDDRLKELLIPIVQNEFIEKIAPAIEANINDRIDNYMLKVKAVVKQTLKEIFDDSSKEENDNSNMIDPDPNN